MGTNNIEDILSLSPMQQGMLYHSILAPGSGTYLEQSTWTLSGAFDIPAFRRAWELVHNRHMALRAAFIWEGLDEPLQVIYQDVDLPFCYKDWSTTAEGTTAESEQPARLEAFLQADRERDFDLSVAPLMRLALIRLSPDRLVFVWTHHHLLLDGWSQPILLNDFLALYQSLVEHTPDPLPPVLPYSRYIAWLRGQSAAQAKQAWQNELSGFTAPNALNWGQPERRPGEKEYDVEKMPLPVETSRALNTFARKNGLTLNTIVQGAWALLLSRYTRETDIVFGATVSGRPASVPGADSIVGLLINTLPVRVQVTPETPALDWLHALQAHQAGLREFDFTSLIDIQSWSDVPRGTPLFESLLVYENYPASPMDGQMMGGFEVLGNDNFSRTNYPLTFAVSPGEPVRWMIAYETARFEQATVRRMFGHLQVLLEAVLRDPHQPVGTLPILTEAENRQILSEWSERPCAADLSKTALDLFAEQARTRPDAAALRYEGRVVTYQELDKRSNQLAHALLERGVQPGTIVGLCMAACPEMVVAMLGIQKAGAAYLPLDPAYPIDRLAFMAADSGITLLLTQTHLLGSIHLPVEKVLCLDENPGSGEWPAIQQQPDTHPAIRALADDPAYIIYTSGSTGRPKGTRLLHRGLSNLVQSCRVRMDVQTDSIVLQFFSISFDPSVQEIFTTLASGACLLLARREVLTSPADLKQLINAQQVTHFSCTPLYLALLDPQEYPSLKVVVSGGEVLPVETARRWSSRANLTFLNEYGPTETTVTAVLHPVKDVPADAQRIPIGRPFPNARIYILDERLLPVPEGIPGELHIGGAGVGGGYLNRPDLEQTKFTADPFHPGERMYKTGDLARWLADGSIDFLGRLDNQVKIRGFRVEPGEIETALLDHPAVRQTAVIAYQESDGAEKSLVAYIVANEPANPPDAGHLSEHLRTSLPAYMIPARFILLDALPLTPSGKIDRRRLPVPEKMNGGEGGGFRAPFTIVQQGLADLWRQILHVENAGLNDDFFALGGHSLRAAQLVSRIREVFQVEFPLRDLFAYQTLTAMAARIETLLTENHGQPLSPILPASQSGDIPLSFAQQRLWFLEQLAPGSLFYNLPLAVRLEGKIDLEAFQYSLDEIVQRHGSLRTRFVERSGKAVQQILPELRIPIQFADLSCLPEAEREAAALRLANEEALKTFNLAEGSLLRVLLIRLCAEEHIALMVMHHIISDGWSLGVLLRELEALYTTRVRGEPSPLPALPVQYADYATWQREWLQGERLEEQLAYWKTQLAHLPPLIELPTDRPRPAVQTSNGDVYTFELPSDLTNQLAGLCQDEGVTLFMTLLSAFQVLLARYSGQDDIPVGTAVANRGRTEIEGLIGFFVNTLVLRARIGETASFRDLLRQVRETCLGAYAHQDLPFELLVEALHPERDLSHTPLFQAMFVMEPLPDSAVQLPGLKMSTMQQHTGTATFDLTLQIAAAPGHLYGSLEFNTDLWERDTIRRMAENFQALLAAITTDPEQPVWTLPYLSDEEKHRLLVAWNQTAAPAPLDRCLHDLFAERVHQQPDAEALIFSYIQSTTVLTYGELNARANQLARYLRRHGVGMETIVAISTTRSLESIIGILGVMKAGGAYLPLDPNYPADRLAFMLEDSHAPVLLTQSALVERLPLFQSGWQGKRICLDTDWAEIAQEADDNLAVKVSPENLAYVIYTSGSTGKPKGALLEHRGLCNLAEVQRQTFQVAAGCRILQFSPFSFDASVWETAMALANGAALVLTPQEVLSSTPDLIKLMQKARITHITLPPSVLQVLPQEELPEMRVVVAAGEACPAELVARWAPGRSFFNAYGPTETTVCASMHLCTPEESGMPPIGRPLNNVRLYVCDSRQQLVPIGVPGELLVGGVNLARGYLDRPQMTAERFISDPFGGAIAGVSSASRLYRTGDLVRYNATGEVEFLGRIDQQVKIRGFRVELGEIEEALRKSPKVHQAAVIARSLRREGPLNDQLVGYVVPANAPDLTPSELQDFLRKTLPDYMVPSVFILLDAMPISPAGKIDRRSLPNPDIYLKNEAREYVAPRNETESKLAQMCAELLNLEQVGITDNFFDLGGHSLLATQFISRIREAFQVEIPLRSLFEHPNICELAEEMERCKTAAPAPSPAPITRVSRDQFRRKRSEVSSPPVEETNRERIAND